MRDRIDRHNDGGENCEEPETLADDSWFVEISEPVEGRLLAEQNSLQSQ